VTVTLLILPEETVTEIPLFGLAWVLPSAGVMVTWAGGEADGLPAACWCWPAPLGAGELEHAAASRDTSPKTAMMPSPTRRLPGVPR
jgi:hypothetical protein